MVKPAAWAAMFWLVAALPCRAQNVLKNHRGDSNKLEKLLGKVRQKIEQLTRKETPATGPEEKEEKEEKKEDDRPIPDLKVGQENGGGISGVGGSLTGVLRAKGDLPISGVGEDPPPADSGAPPASSAKKKKRKAIPDPVAEDLGPSRFQGPPPDEQKVDAADDLIADNALLQSPGQPADMGRAQGRLDDSPMNKRVSLPPMPSDPKRRPSVDFVRGAKTKIALKDYAGAIEDATKAVAEDPANPESYVRRAEASILLQRNADAERDALIATKINSSYPNGHQILAWVRLKQQRYPEAAETASKAIALHDDPTSRLIRSYAKEMLGERASALSDLEAAATLDPRLRGKLEAARSGGKIYDPDKDTALASEVAGTLDENWTWPVAGLAGGGLFAAGVMAFFFRRRRAERHPRVGSPSSAAQKQVEGRLGGKYEVLRVIGRGGMGTVYEATDHTLGRLVAIKKVSEELSEMGARAREMLLKEARTVASLHHPAIVEIYEIFEEGPDFYVVFELVTGKTAAQLLAERGKLSPQDCLGILRPVCEALDYAHGRSLVHRDLKPANIMVTELGQVKLMDFGIARSVADAVPAEDAASSSASAWLARTRTVVGTPAYMAPEAEQGLVSKATDIYALGVCLYEFSTGRKPFSPQATVLERLSARLTLPSQLDAALAPIDALVLSALELSPAARPASAGAFSAAHDAAARKD